MTIVQKIQDRVRKLRSTVGDFQFTAQPATVLRCCDDDCCCADRESSDSVQMVSAQANFSQPTPPLA